MLFSRATRKDFPEVMTLYRRAILNMDEQHIYQWDEIYPDRHIIREDVARGRMEVGRIDGSIAVAFVIEFCKSDDYEDANWCYDDENIAVLHRLCVHPAYQGRGVAREAMDYIEQSVLDRGVHTVRLDAFSQNPYALRLYERRGYEKAGEITFRKGLFYLYEKKL